MRARAKLVVLAGAALLAGCGHEEARVPAAADAGLPARLARVERRVVSDWLEAVGTVAAAQTTQLSSQTMGTILQVRVREGDRVRRGEVLVVIDDGAAKAAAERATAAESAARQEIAVAESNAQLAEATFLRYQTLYQRKSVSPQEFDEVSARRRAAQAQRELAGSGLRQAQAAKRQADVAWEYTRLRAPFDGVITRKLADAGTMAAPGLPLLTVEDTSRFRLETTLDESHLEVARRGEKIAVTLDALPGVQLNGTVTQIVPAADSASRSFMVKLDLPWDRRLRPGLFGRARFARGTREVVTVPGSAVMDRGQWQGVYVVSAARMAELRYITLGHSHDGRVEVLAGLSGGEQVVADPGDRELGGRRVLPE
jgi:membrane fusion protein, multidrug efflux system